MKISNFEKPHMLWSTNFTGCNEFICDNAPLCTWSYHELVKSEFGSSVRNKAILNASFIKSLFTNESRDYRLSAGSSSMIAANDCAAQQK